MPRASIWLMLLAGAAATYVWRGIGVALSGRIDPNGDLFRWVSYVAYALLAGLVARMIVLPIGVLQGTPLGARLASAALALAAFYVLRKNVLLAAAVGVGALALLARLAGPPG